MTTNESYGFDKRWIAAGLAVLAIALGATGLALANNDSTATCPDGQSLAVSQVNGDTFSQSKPPPPGDHYSDSVSGSGLDYTLNSDNDSATLKVHGKGMATLKVECR
jgi:hypothetical protein